MRQKSAAEGHWFGSGAAAPIPIPLDTFLFKVASRCNLACPYCYVYELRDQSWQAQPTFMSAETHGLALDRIRDHVVAHAIPIVTAIFHGGEPLLIGPRGLEEMAVRTRNRLGGVAEVHFGLQTNGTLFDERFLEVALRHQIRVGLSVDGPPRHHDRYRYQPNGLGSSERVEKTAALLRDNADAFGGILCVVNLDIDPSEVWDYLCGFRPKSIDLLLPLATHDHLPPGAAAQTDVVRYGQWLVRFLELWYKAGDDRPDIRYFSSIMRLLLGRGSLVESIGIGLSTLIIIESNGDLEAVDSLKACYHGAASTGLNISTSALDEALEAPAIMSRQMGSSSLCSTCRGCDFLDVCGGGYQPHRYSEARGFQNPSIYCDAIQLLVGRIAELMKEELANAMVSVPSLVEVLADGRCCRQRF
jgi:uncharacterized protein